MVTSLPVLVIVMNVFVGVGVGGGDGRDDEDHLQACRRVFVPPTRSWDLTHQVLKILEVFIVPLLLSLTFAVQYHYNVFVHLGKNCPKTLGSSVTLIEKTLRHSRYFLL